MALKAEFHGCFKLGRLLAGIDGLKTSRGRWLRYRVYGRMIAL